MQTRLIARQARDTSIKAWTFVATAALMCISGFAQSEGSGKTVEIPGRHTLSGTLLRTVLRKSFSERLGPGLYRLTYLSAQAPAVLEVSARGQLVGRAAPTRPFLTVLNGSTGEPIDLPPTGLCSSDVAAPGMCAVEKLHFRLKQSQLVTISVAGQARWPGRFRIIVDPLVESPEIDTLQPGTIYTGYLAFSGDPTSDKPHEEFRLRVPKGTRAGIFLGSPDFTTQLELRDFKGRRVATNTEFNQWLDPCHDIRIDHLPKFDPLSQSDAYLVVDGDEADVYTVAVNGRYPGETGLFVLRIFDVSDLTLTPGQMRTGYLRSTGGPRFTLGLPAGWHADGNSIKVYSEAPIAMELRDENGKLLKASVVERPNDFESGVRPHQLSMLHSSSIELDGLDPGILSKAFVVTKRIEEVPDQFFLLGLAAPWGACGGGAVDPIAISYPPLSEFRDQGFPITVPKLSTAQLEEILYGTARGRLQWFFLLQAPNGEDKDPEDLVSSYTRLNTFL